MASSDAYALFIPGNTEDTAKEHLTAGDYLLPYEGRATGDEHVHLGCQTSRPWSVVRC